MKYRGIVILSLIAMVALLASCEPKFEGTEYVPPYYKMGSNISDVEKYMKTHTDVFDDLREQRDNKTECYKFREYISYRARLDNMGIVSEWNYIFTDKGLVYADAQIMLGKIKHFDRNIVFKNFNRVDVARDEIRTCELYIDETESLVVICDIYNDTYIFDASVKYFDRTYLECNEGQSYIDYFNHSYK